MAGVSSVSAATLTYEEACAALDLDPAEPRASWGIEDANSDRRGVQLKPWQVQGIAWMAQQESSPLQGGILADACGLGKTSTILGLIAYRAQQQCQNAEE